MDSLDLMHSGKKGGTKKGRKKGGRKGACVRALRRGHAFKGVRKTKGKRMSLKKARAACGVKAK